jgi:hypothetical protein
MELCKSDTELERVAILEGKVAVCTKTNGLVLFLLLELTIYQESVSYLLQHDILNTLTRFAPHFPTRAVKIVKYLYEVLSTEQQVLYKQPLLDICKVSLKAAVQRAELTLSTIIKAIELSKESKYFPYKQLRLRRFIDAYPD